MEFSLTLSPKCPRGADCLICDRITGWKPVSTIRFPVSNAKIIDIRSKKQDMIFAIEMRKSHTIFTCNCPIVLDFAPICGII